jgi:hypothetical protein
MDKHDRLAWDRAEEIVRANFPSLLDEKLDTDKTRVRVDYATSEAATLTVHTTEPVFPEESRLHLYQGHAVFQGGFSTQLFNINPANKLRERAPVSTTLRWLARTGPYVLASKDARLGLITNKSARNLLVHDFDAGLDRVMAAVHAELEHSVEQFGISEERAKEIRDELQLQRDMLSGDSKTIHDWGKVLEFLEEIEMDHLIDHEYEFNLVPDPYFLADVLVMLHMVRHLDLRGDLVSMM